MPERKLPKRDLQAERNRVLKVLQTYGPCRPHELGMAVQRWHLRIVQDGERGPSNYSHGAIGRYLAALLVEEGLVDRYLHRYGEIRYKLLPAGLRRLEEARKNGEAGV